LEFDTNFDVAVIGGGVAGSSAAIGLAKRGLKVCLFEKEKSIRPKVCGEFLSGESLPFLTALGVDVVALGATQIHSFRLHVPNVGKVGKGALWPVTLKAVSCEVKLPQPAMGLSRVILDEALLKRAVDVGVTVFRGETVVDIVDVVGVEVGGVGGLGSMRRSEIRTLSRQIYKVDNVVLATGKHSFSKLNPRVGKDNDMVGFHKHLMLDKAAMNQLRGHCELFLFDHGYGGLVPVSDQVANLCFVIKRSAIRDIGSSWGALLAHLQLKQPCLKDYLLESEPIESSYASIAPIPYGFVCSRPPRHGLYLIGDQMAVIPSLAGDGIAMALSTASSCVRHICDSHDAATAYRRLGRQIGAGRHGGPGRDNGYGRRIGPDKNGRYIGGTSPEVRYQGMMKRIFEPRVLLAYQIHRLFQYQRFMALIASKPWLFKRIVRILFNATRAPIEV
jgi:flavin-dependent dehydrogenase